MDRIYFIQHGEFEMTRTIELPFVKPKVDTAPDPAIDISKYRQHKNLHTFNKKFHQNKQELVQICILSDNDMFGLEEYMEKEPLR